MTVVTEAQGHQDGYSIIHKDAPAKKYKNGLVYIYCTPEDRDRARYFADELGCDMKTVIHRLLFAAEIAVPNKTKVSVLNGAAFWEMFDFNNTGVDEK